ncbi:hypothetical protein [Dictyobacter arantiisoli]|uniref:hypothetical protein n=1 Tax=Dictyobacter arantiisoli TaxID=2014874 RepID=UPI0011EE48B5|nr:hypothetical protein [Dictyobacter arantiisoli]
MHDDESFLRVPLPHPSNMTIQMPQRDEVGEHLLFVWFSRRLDDARSGYSSPHPQRVSVALPTTVLKASPSFRFFMPILNSHYYFIIRDLPLVMV